MINDNSIIYYLDNSLKIYRSDLVNADLKLIFEKEKHQGRLNLAVAFSRIWQDLYKSHIENSSNLILIIGNEASFSDSRIMHIWLKSHQLFKNCLIKTLRVDRQLNQRDFNNFCKSGLGGFADTDLLLYSGEPRIGKYNQSA